LETPTTGAKSPAGTVREIPACGHAPALMSPELIAIVEGWLETRQIRDGLSV
jgi:hypothetical protein